ncbi:MAG: hypothetical protein KTR32_40560 [Granulosicoccus sp.]|nr:hypothetical protein [Granulosicoccus sp.]
MAAHIESLTPYEQAPSVHQPDWPTLRLLNQYRLLILMALTAAYYLANDSQSLGSVDPRLFSLAHAGYLLCTITFAYLIKIQRPSVEPQFYLQNYLDILFISALMFASGGVTSGIGSLLVVNIALLSQLTSTRTALMFAAIASMVVIVEELLLKSLVSVQLANLEATALLGSLLFLIAWLMTVPLRHLMKRQLVNSSRSRVTLDVTQLAQLNEEIIRELDSGVIVTDQDDNVQLINDTARSLLAAELVQLPVRLKKLSAELTDNKIDSQRSLTFEARSIEITSTGQSVLPHYINLSNGGMLIRLDDHAHIRQQFQQLKLASLGRLSASIAHEIRNPLGAIHHAVQLIEESDSLNSNDAELVGIAKRHTYRINRIIDDILQLSNRQLIRPTTIFVNEIIERFAIRFKSENELGSNQLQTRTQNCIAIFDPEHLDQVLWNLCNNALLHNQEKALCIDISCTSTSPEITVIDVVDNGKGISRRDQDRLFEPFFSTHHEGTGLGLFIIRELCTLNKAQIEFVPSDSGTHFRITLSNASNLAA